MELLLIIISTLIISLFAFLLINKKIKKQSKKTEISILIGSGFSRPYGLPLVSEINSAFTNLQPEEIFIGSDMTAFLLNGQEDLNSWMNENERYFFTDFINFYCEEIGGRNNFNYEKFYDYYYSFYRGETNNRLKEFCTNYIREKGITSIFMADPVNLIMQFNRVFQQLLAGYLRRSEFFENDVHNFDYSPYNEFIKFLETLTQNEIIINIHTLNHDMLLEHMNLSTALSTQFCDGYSELGSRYYGEYRIPSGFSKKFMVRLKYFSNNFSNNIRLFKLHGSIDTYSFNLNVSNIDRTRIKTDYGIEDFFMESHSEVSNKLEYIRGITSKFPDFLSGTTEKIINYSDEYYDKIFTHFRNNLTHCEKLIVIGYGFWDDGINKIIKEYFLNKGIKPIVIDPNISASPFYQNNDFTHVHRSITQLSCEELLEL